MECYLVGREWTSSGDRAGPVPRGNGFTVESSVGSGMVLNAHWPSSLLYAATQGKGAGKVRLNMRYFPFEQLTAEHMKTAGEVRQAGSRGTGLRACPALGMALRRIGASC